MTGDDDNEIGEGADGEVNENAVVCCYLRVTATPIDRVCNKPCKVCCVTLTVRACVFVCQDIILTKAGSPILRIGMPPKHEKRKNVKTRLYCMRLDVAVVIHRTHKHGQTSV